MDTNMKKKNREIYIIVYFKVEPKSYTCKQSAIWQILVFTEVLFSPLPLGEWLMCGVHGGVTQLQCAGLSSLLVIVSEISLSHSA